MYHNNHFSVDHEILRTKLMSFFMTKSTGKKSFLDDFLIHDCTNINQEGHIIKLIDTKL